MIFVQRSPDLRASAFIRGNISSRFGFSVVNTSPTCNLRGTETRPAGGAAKRFLDYLLVWKSDQPRRDWSSASRFPVGAFLVFIISMNASKRYDASWGPGLASGWYWTEKTGSFSWRKPSTVLSLR